MRFIEVRDRNDNILVYVEQLPGALQNAAPIDIFHSTIQRQRIALASDPLLDGASEATASPARTTSAGWWSACPTTPSASGNRKSS